MNNNYNFLKPVKIGQNSEDVSRNITETDKNIAKHVPLVLTTDQRVGLALELKVANRLVYDVDMGQWFKWAVGAGGVYTWQNINFNTNYYLYNVQQRVWNTKLSTDTSTITIDESILPYNPLTEVMMVMLDGTVLTQDKQYRISTNTISCLSFSGTWFAGQELSIVIFHASNTTEDSVLTEIKASLNELDGNVDAIWSELEMKNVIRMWT